MIWAERALHDRTSWACAAASAAGVPGRFRAWEQDGVLAILATDPALAFLSSVSGVVAETVPAAIDLVDAPVWPGVRPALVVPADLAEPAVKLLSQAGFAPDGARPLAINRPVTRTEADPDVVEDGAEFADVLSAGYEVSGAVAAFIRAEHRLAGVRRFVLVERGTPIAAAAMTVHGGVAVLGGASTLRAHRRKGAQGRLLRHRLHVAAQSGCDRAVATATAGSVSAANLRRAGFALHRRTAWVRSG